MHSCTHARTLAAAMRQIHACVQCERRHVTRMSACVCVCACVCVQVNVPLGEAIAVHTKHTKHARTQEPSKQNARIAQNFLWATRSMCKGEPILAATEQTAAPAHQHPATPVQNAASPAHKQVGHHFEVEDADRPTPNAPLSWHASSASRKNSTQGCTPETRHWTGSTWALQKCKQPARHRSPHTQPQQTCRSSPNSTASAASCV